MISGSEPRASPAEAKVCLSLLEGNGFLSVQKSVMSLTENFLTENSVALGPPATRTLVGTREGLGSVAWGWGGWGAGGRDQTAGGGLECGEPGRAVIQSVDKNVGAA